MLIITIFFAAIFIACAAIPYTRARDNRREARDLRAFVERWKERQVIIHPGPALVVKRGLWSKNDVFGRCSCGGLTIYGQCQSCSTIIQCANCLQIRTINGWRRADKKLHVSHTVCKKCAKILYPEPIYKKIWEVQNA